MSILKRKVPLARLLIVTVFNWPFLVKICQVTLRSEKDLFESFDCDHLPYPCK